MYDRGRKMDYKIAICDDCAADTDYLSVLAGNWAKASGSRVTIQKFSSSEAFLFCYEEEKDFDILLLDIEMGGKNGVELAGKIREGNDTVQIVFVTGFPDYMAQGYEVSALHYLIKPVDQDKLYAVLDRAAANLMKVEKRLKVTFDRQTDFIPLGRIMYIEANKQFVCIHTKDNIYRMKSSLAETEAALDERFFRCQRSFLVNLGFVVRIRNNCVVLKNGEEISISRGKAKEIAEAIIRLF